jgi:hypothetical protein
MMENNMPSSIHQLRSSIFTVSLAALLTLTPISAAFSQSSAQTPAKPSDSTDADNPAPATIDPLHATPAENMQTAWSMLDTALNAFKDQKHSDLRIEALAALGTMGGNPRAERMIACLPPGRRITATSATSSVTSWTTRSRRSPSPPP